MKHYLTRILKSDTSSSDMNEKVDRWLDSFENFHKKYIIMLSESLNMAKCLLKVAGTEAKAACGTTQLVGVLEEGIDGAIHAMRVLWEEHKKEEDWGFLLIDVRNTLNEENRTAMLWAVRHE